MANVLYGKALEFYSFPSILSDTIKAVIVETGGGNYVIDPNVDRYLSAILVADRIATSGALTGKTFTNGVFKCDGFSYGVLASGGPYGALVLYHDTGDAATSELLVYIDTMDGLPLSPSGFNDVAVVWPTAGVFLL